MQLEVFNFLWSISFFLMLFLIYFLEIINFLYYSEGSTKKARLEDVSGAACMDEIMKAMNYGRHRRKSKEVLYLRVLLRN